MQQFRGINQQVPRTDPTERSLKGHLWRIIQTVVVGLEGFCRLYDLSFYLHHLATVSGITSNNPETIPIRLISFVPLVFPIFGTHALWLLVSFPVDPIRFFQDS